VASQNGRRAWRHPDCRPATHTGLIARSARSRSACRLAAEQGEQPLHRLQWHLRGSGAPAFVFVDTSAAFFDGGNENDNPAMWLHASHRRRLTEPTGRPSVTVLCHPTGFLGAPGRRLPPEPRHGEPDRASPLQPAGRAIRRPARHAAPGRLQHLGSAWAH
jgi:hypothetical protein